MNFLHDTNYLSNIEETLAKAEKISIAIAFWGQGAESHFLSLSAEMRIICNLSSGGTNPETIEKLIQLSKSPDHIQVKQLDTLHAKVLITQRDLILGSANFSTNGLHFEGGELDGWIEAGLMTNEAPIVRQAQDWFESLWTSAYPITDQDLIEAKQAWLKAREKRSLVSVNKKLDKASLLNRPVSLILWQDNVTQTDINNFKDGIKDQDIDSSNLDFYAFKPEDGVIPENHILIDVSTSVAGQEFSIHDGVYRRLPQLDRPGWPYQTVEWLAKTCDYPIDNPIFNQKLKKYIQKYLEAGGKRVGVVSLSDIWLDD